MANFPSSHTNKNNSTLAIKLSCFSYQLSIHVLVPSHSGSSAWLRLDSRIFIQSQVRQSLNYPASPIIFSPLRSSTFDIAHWITSNLIQNELQFHWVSEQLIGRVNRVFIAEHQLQKDFWLSLLICLRCFNSHFLSVYSIWIIVCL